MVILLQQKNFGPNVVYYASKWHPEGVPKASRASKMSPNASQKAPEDVQERQRSVQEAQSSIYSCFIAFSGDPHPPAAWGGSPNNLPVREVNWTKHHKTPTSSAQLSSNQHSSSTHWCAGGHGADLKAKASCRRPPKYKKMQNIENTKMKIVKNM